ncbi:DUF1330 domain-containing protein [Roseovarius pelagicus]|uniref:DUF1330 domain-containing protein n=1 Tax=Roseovarius pelagicus TaxID=2980108 RepID=A0ABY6D8F2_9RHOB|nr:DUF1330 domain-containing protein [Roseovarius pelagicus]UXX82375.1 DUF1330 domain-containing protein [Roseovarius pelagicus]
MTAYSILAVTPTSEGWIPSYIEPVGKIIAKHGGKYLVRTTSHEQVEGADSPAALRIILEWPDRQAALNFVNDPDYAPYLKARREGSDSVHFVVEGKDDLA